MKREHAYEAIKAILAAIDDDELPKPDKLEKGDDGKTVVWFGGMGRILGSGKRNGRREPLIYHERAASDAIQLEAIYRLDRAHLEAEASR